MKTGRCRLIESSRTSRGLSLVELLVSLALGLMIISGMLTLLARNSETRGEIEKAGRQVENGRYAIQRLSEDLHHAGFYGEFYDVPAGTSVVGTFDREFAVADETIDFFSSGHPLVEGLLAHFEDDPKGRVARLEVRFPGETGRGIVAIYKEGPRFEVRALDSEGRPRPEWAAAFGDRPLRAARMTPVDATEYDWRGLATRLAPQLDDREAYAVAAIVVRSR